MDADGNVNNLVNTIVHHPVFKETINAILSVSNTQPSTSVSPATDQTDNRSTNVTSHFGSSICNTGRNQRRFHSPAQELSAIFRRGGNSTFQRGINHKPRRPVPYQRAAAATSTSTVNRNRIFRTKEVILLPGVAENEVVRGPRKSDLMGQGFIRSELEINKCWSEVEIMDFLEKLNQIPKEDGKFRYEKCFSFSNHSLRLGKSSVWNPQITIIYQS